MWGTAGSYLELDDSEERALGLEYLPVEGSWSVSYRISCLAKKKSIRETTQIDETEIHDWEDRGGGAGS